MTEDFIHIETAGDPQRCTAMQRKVDTDIALLYENGEIEGYWIAYVEDRKAAREKFIGREAIEQVKKKFPFIYLRINFSDEVSAVPLRARVKALQFVDAS